MDYGRQHLESIDESTGPKITGNLLGSHQGGGVVVLKILGGWRFEDFA